MDFDDTPEEAAFRAEARAFLDANATRRTPGQVEGYRRGQDKPGALEAAKDFQRRKHEAGFAGIAWPREWGGRGGTPIQEVIYNQEESKYDVLTGTLRHRPQHGDPDHLHPWHAAAARALSRARAARRGGVVPAVLRAGRRIGPRRSAHARGARRRRVGHQRPEDLDLGRALLPLRRAGRAHRLRRAEAQGPHLLSSCRWTARGWRSARSGRFRARRISTRCSSAMCGSRTPTASAGSARAGAWR